MKFLKLPHKRLLINAVILIFVFISSNITVFSAIAAPTTNHAPSTKVNNSTNLHAELYKKREGFYSYIIGNIDGSNLIEHHADVYITPMSCQKVVTALLSLKELGPDFRYKTSLYVTKEIKENAAIKDIIISFSADPTLTSQDIINLLKPLKAKLKGKKIRGKIILDASMFQTPPHSPYIFVGDIGTKFGRPVSAISIDNNWINITTKFNSTKFDANFDANFNDIKKNIVIENDAGYNISPNFITSDTLNSFKAPIKTPVKTVFQWQGNNIKAIIKEPTHSTPVGQQEYLKFQPQTSKTTISPLDIEHFILNKLKLIAQKYEYLKGKEIEIQKDAKRLPHNKQLIKTHESKPLKQILPVAFKESDNLIFDSLYLRIIYRHNKDITAWDEGSSIFKNLLQKHFSVKMNNAFFVDGSGISRYNRIKTKQLFELLQNAHQIKEFINCFPKPGEINSTLETRKNLPPTIIAKSGTGIGTSCLCGYNNSNPKKVFAITVNNSYPPKEHINNVLDKFLADYFN